MFAASTEHATAGQGGSATKAWALHQGGRERAPSLTGTSSKITLERPAMITGKSPPVAEEAQTVTQEPLEAADQAFADKLAKRLPPHPVERAQIEKARKRTKARAPRIAMHIEAHTIPRPFGRRRTPLPACRRLRNALAAIRSFDAQRFRECDRGPLAEPRL
jgi:hypothetical protein